MTKPILTAEEYEKIGSLDELLETLQKKDAHVRSKKQAYKFAKQEWWDLNRKETYASNNGLPGESVKIGDITYHVHGVNHGFLGVKDNVKDYLRTETKKFLDAGCPVYVEEGFKGVLFEDMAVEEMTDIRIAIKNYPDYIKYAAKRTAVLPLKMVSTGLVFLVSSIFPNSKKRGIQLSNVLYKTLSDTNSIANLQNATKSYFLPEPLECDWNKDYNKESLLTINKRSEIMAYLALKHESFAQEKYERAKLGGDVSEDKEPDTIIEKIVYNKIKNAKNAIGAKEIHVIVGAGHQPGILYYLKKKARGVAA